MLSVCPPGGSGYPMASRPMFFPWCLVPGPFLGEEGTPVSPGPFPGEGEGVPLSWSWLRGGGVPSFYLQIYFNKLLSVSVDDLCEGITCSGKGRCEGGSCTCHPGFSGENCESTSLLKDETSDL